jgi:hypothetical protein
MASQHHERIGPTAHYTAFAWHKLGLPYATAFATPRGRALYWAFKLAGEWTLQVHPHRPSMLQYLGYRHRMIEAALRRANPDRIVELGAGLSRRGITWAADHGVDVIEVDLPHMVRAKRDAMDALPLAARTAASRRLRHVSLDLLGPEFPAALARLLDGATRPALIAEGVISYFDFDDRTVLFAAIAAALRRSGGGRFFGDFQTATAQAEVASSAALLRTAIKVATGGRGTRPPFRDLDHARELFLGAGFDELHALRKADFVADDPALAHTMSPATIFEAVVRPRPT